MILKLIISGKVQGVGFRKSVYSFVKNNKLSLVGIVRNLVSGEVEVIAKGSETVLEVLLLFCQRGPKGSQVVTVKKEELEVWPMDLIEISEFVIHQ